MSDAYSPLADFQGHARLFPLPNLVFFPHVVQPLHIFEPRYRQMTADALDGDRLIALVLPRSGWENDYAGKPAIHEVGCLGKIVAEQKLEDGRFNLLLRGVSRIRVIEELLEGKLYRKAHVELLAESPLADAQRECWYRNQLFECAPKMFPPSGKVNAEFRKLLKADLPLGALADLVAFALPLDHAFKQSLLEELDVERRLSRLIVRLGESAPAVAGAPRKFPPDFSVN